jgi:PAS domain S-box-containing protein
MALAMVFQIVLCTVLMASHHAFSLGAREFDESLRFTSRSSAILMDFFKLRDLLVHDPITSPKIDRTLQAALDNILVTDQAQVTEGRLTQQQFDHMRDQILECIKLLQAARFKEQEDERLGKPKHVPWDAMHQISAIMSAEASEFSQLYLDEQIRIEQLIVHQKDDNQSTETLLCVGIVLELLLLAISIAWYKRSTTPKIAAVMRNIQRFSQQQELRQPVPGEDELSTLDRAFYSAATTLNEARVSERDLMERQRDVISRLDERLVFTQINRACASAFGNAPEDVIGKTLLDIVREPEQAESIKQQFASARTGKAAAFEIRITRPDHSTIEMQTAVSWLEYDHSFVCVMHDITARKHADRLQQELLQMISHDMRTPLTTICGAFEIFEFAGVSQETTALLEAGQAASAQMMSLVDHFLKIERIKAGMFELEMESGSLESLLLAAAEKAVEKHAGEPSAAFKIGPSSIELMADRERLEDTLTDLFTIALDSEPADGEIGVEIEQSKPEDKIQIRIKPSGSGTRNTQAVQDRSVMERLILPLCHMIVELHGGTLMQQGATFTICLPQSSAASPK